MFYSQFKEDRILFEIFRHKKDGICVEVGANNGVDDSTTLFFEETGWMCILVEPNPSLCEVIRAKRKALLFEYAASNRKGTATLCVVEGAQHSDALSTISPHKEYYDRIKELGFVNRPIQVATMTLDDILTQAHISNTIDFISIDVEGHELEAVQGFSIEKWKPTIMLVENNSNLENKTLSNYLRQFGYVRFLRTGVNDWYAHQSNEKLVNTASAVQIGISKLEMGLKRALIKLLNLIKFRRDR